MKQPLSALVLSLALVISSASAQQFPTVKDHTVIGRVGTGSGSGPSQAIPFATLGTLIGALPPGVSVIDPGTGKLEMVMPITNPTVSGNAYTILASDLFKELRVSNSGTSFSLTFPSSSTIGLANGTRLQINNTDSTATATLNAGSGEQICVAGSCGSSTSLGPLRSSLWIYDTTGVTPTWRPTMNSLSSLLSSNNLSDLSSVSTARTNLNLQSLYNISAVSHQWVSSVTNGTPTLTQPSCSDLSNAAASCSTDATNASNISSGSLSNARLAAMTAWTIKMNNTSGSATPTDITIDGLTVKASPAASDEIPIWDAAASAMKKATVSSIATAGSVASVNGQTGAVTLQGATTNGSGTIYNQFSGYVNKLRNSSLTSWFHGSGTLTITTSGGWCLEGIYVVPTGASVTCARNTNGLSNPLTFYSQLITGNTSVTDITVRFVIESFDAAPLAGQQVTCQIPVLNNTGGSITPTITVKRANTQDATYTNTDVSAASLQAIANGATGTLAYSWAANASSFNGLSIDIDFGNNFSTSGKSIQIGGGFDCRVTPSQSTGTVSSPPTPEIRTTTDDIAWNKRFFETSCPNGTTFPTTGNSCLRSIGTPGAANDTGSIFFATTKRTSTPTNIIDDGNSASNAYSIFSSGTRTDGRGSLTVLQNGSDIILVNFGNGAVTANGFAQWSSDASLTGG